MITRQQNTIVAETRVQQKTKKADIFIVCLVMLNNGRESKKNQLWKQMKNAN